MNRKNLIEVDWGKIPAPIDDGGAAHLAGMRLPAINLLATGDTSVTRYFRRTGMRATCWTG